MIADFPYVFPRPVLAMDDPLMRTMRRVGAVAAGVVAVALVAGCSQGGGDDGGDTKAPEPTVTSTSPEPDASPSTEDEYPGTPQGDFNRMVDEKGWEYGYETASANVSDICVSLPDQAKYGDPGEWLVVNQKPSADEKKILLAGMPKLCPKWASTVKKALAGDYTRTYSDGTYVVKAHPKEKDLDSDVQEIAPGSYRTSGDLADCYWERTTKSGQIIDNSFATSAQSITVSIAASDGQFTTRDCGAWRPVK
ncbi:hypothetical protein [Streptomyces sp. NPDC058142]|uniref:hypothetical protein n=1 Tax=Streptomyces sp. NPDC058142 TaxID=3346355 RepID=UPI0036EAC406